MRDLILRRFLYAGIFQYQNWMDLAVAAFPITVFPTDKCSSLNITRNEPCSIWRTNYALFRLTQSLSAKNKIRIRASSRRLHLFANEITSRCFLGRNTRQKCIKSYYSYNFALLVFVVFQRPRPSLPESLIWNELQKIKFKRNYRNSNHRGRW